MNRIALTLAVVLILTACSSTTRPSIASPITGAADTPDFVLTDLQNAQAIFDDSYRRTANPYDAAGSRCTAAIITHRDELNALNATPATPPLGAPVMGVFSRIARAQVTAEDAQARIAAKLALLRNGIPPDVHIACAYMLVEPAALLRGLARKGGGS